MDFKQFLLSGSNSEITIAKKKLPKKFMKEFECVVSSFTSLNRVKIVGE